MTVLVVDDNPAARRMLRHRFEERGYRVVEASTSTDAQELARAERPELMVLDLQLNSEPDGHALLVVMRERYGSQIPIVACSGSVDFGDREAMRLAGWTDVWPKPFTTIPKWIEQWLPSKSAPVCSCGGRGYNLDGDGQAVLCTSCVLRRLSHLEALHGRTTKGD